MDILYIIPARSGSKRILGKNFRLLEGIPLIRYTLDTLLQITDPENICVSTDSEEIISITNAAGIRVPFKRPEELAGDKIGSYEVIMHAVEHYKSQGRNFDAIMMLQPTSPFRKPDDVRGITTVLQNDPEAEMIVSVGISAQNPYYTLFEENEKGFLRKSKESNYIRMQDVPPVYFYNGSMYLMRTKSIEQMHMHKLEKVRKFVMDEISSLDVDTPLDWLICETILKNGLYTPSNSVG